MAVSIPLMDKDLKELPPRMGFLEEQYIPQSRGPGGGWTEFYTCICNGKRVYVWAFGTSGITAKMEKECCVMLRDSIDPLRNASVEEIQNAFAHQHTEQRERYFRRTFHIPADPFVLQAFINEVTLGGNEKMYLEKLDV